MMRALVLAAGLAAAPPAPGLAGAEPAEGAAGLPPGIDPSVLEIEGDAEYGEYLASECAACHRREGADPGIPPIAGLPEDAFIVAMQSYKTGLRSHQVMEMVARRLGDEEIAALAAYFAGLDRGGRGD